MPDGFAINITIIIKEKKKMSLTKVFAAFKKIGSFFKETFSYSTELQQKVEENPADYCLLDYVMDYYIYACRETKSENTIKTYKNYQNKYFQGIRYHRLSSLTPALIQGAIWDELSSGKSEKTVKNAFYFLKSVLNYAVENQFMKEPLDLSDVKVKLTPYQVELFVPSEEEAKNDDTGVEVKIEETTE